MVVLYMSRIQVFPIDGGENLRAYSLINSLDKLSSHLYVIIPMKRLDITDSHIAKLDNTEFINHNYSRLNLAFPFYKQCTLRRKIESIKGIDVAVIDYSFYGQYISILKDKGITVIYSTHNAQGELVKQKLFQNIFLRILNRAYSRLVAIHERIYFNKADYVLTVSEKDREYHETFVCKDKLRVIPNSLDIEQYRRYHKVEKKRKLVVFCANFCSFQNVEGFRWFMNEIFDEQLNREIDLLLVGKGSDEILRRFRIGRNENISATGSVNSVLSFVARAQVSIVPLIHGSGTRLKILEAMALKTQIVSTSKGAEGVKHCGTIIIADDKEKFKEGILEAVHHQNEDSINRAFRIVEMLYSFKVMKEALEKILIKQKKELANYER